MAETTKTKLLALLRAILNDNIQNGVDIFQYTISKTFSLSEPNAQTILDVSVNDVSSSTTYVYTQAQQKVEITSSLLTDDIVEINYTFYSNYSDSELMGYINHALMYVSLNQYADWQIKDDDNIYPTISLAELNLIALIASIIIDPQNKSVRTPDFSVIVKNSYSLQEMISRLIGTFKKSPAGIFSILGSNS